ncbi:unannotated protein [freshwater metagenome]|uniref:site-specific DNA-methyltransferase (adenine-specific) n=1 Tax=freshwater metagenome TaxID=449393 RepID=A0A6J7AUF8_9ZZZZ
MSQRYHAVVGNPPYITVKDPALRDLYRHRFTTCRGKYSLGVPFTEQFFHLALGSTHDPARVGYVGMITANSFMKREFGKDLIEKWLPQLDLTHVIDTSGAHIPGHGTPTVILLGRSRRPVSGTLRAVMGIRGEPARPADPAKGVVWNSITDFIDRPGSESPYVSVVELERARLKKHPWSIGGGGAAELKDEIDQRGVSTLRQCLSGPIGFGAISAADETFLLPARVLRNMHVPPSSIWGLAVGDEIRDWTVASALSALFPYSPRLLSETELGGTAQSLWPWRTVLWARATFANKTYREEGRTWWEWHQVAFERLSTPLSIVFAFVATHNHFVLDRGGKVFNRSAPVLKLPAGKGEDAHLELVGLLNSSVACFWMKQVFHNKGGGGSDAKLASDGWENFFEHDGTKLQSFPLPKGTALDYARLLDGLAQDLVASTPEAVAEQAAPTAARLAEARTRFGGIRARMIALQEELDWHVYGLYGLVDEPLTFPTGEMPELTLGERAFEIVLARKAEGGDEETSWFTRHGSKPITEIPSHWPEAYRDLVARRIDVIEADRNVSLIERPEHKRRWNTEPWEKQQAEALCTWLLDRLEAKALWPQPMMRTCAQLGDAAGRDADFRSVAALYAGTDAVDLTKLVIELVVADTVPYLAALRYTDDGMRKYGEWLRTWNLQAAEDRGEDVGQIPVPPKYQKTDFRVGWEHRGKLDVPKERFISYPGAERGADTTPVIGWAGWDHAERARALAAWYLGAKHEGRDAEYLVPLLAGLAELVPWLKQWHNDPSPDPMLDRPGDQIAALVDAETRALNKTAADLAAWRPAAKTRKRRT